MRMKANKSEWESVSDIMKRVSHADLLSHYLGINSLPVLINSPLRKDTHPSFFIYSPDGERVLYKDYATGDYGDIYSLLQNKDNISFSELLHKISLEKSFQKSESNLLSNASPIKRYTKSSRELRVKTREWRKFDIGNSMVFLLNGLNLLEFILFHIRLYTKMGIGMYFMLPNMPMYL